MERYILIKDACQLLGISKPTLYKLLEEKLLPYVQTGNKIRLNREDVEALSTSGWSWNASATA